MLSSRRLPAVFAAVLSLFVLLGFAVSASAAVTVNLRVEGSSSTLFEGPVSTEALPPPGITTTSSPEAHPCDVADNGANEGFVASGPNATSALYSAVVSQGLPFDATWFASLNDFDVTQVGPDKNGGEAEGFPSWGYAVNFTTANVGGCQFQVAPGSEVLWAYNYFNLHHLLDLTGPSSAAAGTTFPVHVVDGQSGAPVAGASIGSFAGGVTTPLGAVTDASGNATVVLPAAGNVALKATQPESVRSNALQVCVHAGNDGTCGASVSSAGRTTTTTTTTSHTVVPVATGLAAMIVGVLNGHTYSRRNAPRVLRGTVKVASGGTLRRVRIRLQRQFGGRCSNFSGRQGRFLRTRKCAAPNFFSVGSSESFSYLLPFRLPVGRYVYDIDAVEASGTATRLLGGVSHVVFRVR
jgi:hypothetical protein